MSDNCGCCDGIEQLTPVSTDNRPGLPALAYRAGTHASFLESMKARLTGLCFGTEEECKAGCGNYPLDHLTTRDSSDPSIALLDAWATVGDVLTFYQERIANEGYLRTATQRRSILELARLIGYSLRPGVAASVHLAFTLDEGAEEVLIPSGTGAKSTPGPGEQTQTFETSADIKARPEWNELKPRLTIPTRISRDNALNLRRIFLEGTSLNLSANDYLVLRIGMTRRSVIRQVQNIVEDFEKNRTQVELQSDDLDRELFVAAVATTIQAFIAELRFTTLPSIPRLVEDFYADLREFIDQDLKLEENTLEALEKIVHLLFSGTGLADPQVWFAKLNVAFEALAGTADKPLPKLGSDLNTVLGDHLTGSSAFKPSCVAIADEYSNLESALTSFENDLTTDPGSRDEARQKATEISHVVQKFAARIEADREFLLTTAAAPLEFSSGGAAEAVDNSIHLSRVDETDESSASYSAQVQISANFVAGEDTLAFTDTAQIKLDAAASTEQMLTLIPVDGVGGATLAEFQSALRSVTIISTGATHQHRRTVSFTLMDGGDAKASGSRTVEIDGDTSGHSLSATFEPLRYQPDSAAAIDDQMLINDPPSGTSGSYVATIRIVANFVAGADVLNFADTAKIEHSDVDARTLRLQVKSGQAVTATEFQDALRAVSFASTEQAPSTTRTISIQLSHDDGGVFDATAYREIDIATSDLDDLIDAVHLLRANVEDKSRTFGKEASPPPPPPRQSPTIPEFYRDDPDSLDASIKAFKSVTFDSPINDDVEQILNQLKTNIGPATFLSVQAQFVETALPLLEAEETNAATAAPPLTILAAKIKQTRLQFEGVLTTSATAVANGARTAKTTFESGAAPILTSLGGSGTPHGGEFNRFLTDVKNITDTLPDPAVGDSLSTRALAVEGAISSLADEQVNAGKLKQGFVDLTGEVQDLRIQLWRTCHLKRMEFRRRILGRIKRSLPLFSGAPFDLETILITLETDVENVDIGTNPPLPGPHFGNPLESLVAPVKTQLKPEASNTLAQILRDETVTLDQFAEPLRSLVEELELIVGQVAGQVAAPASQQAQPIMPDITGLLQQFASQTIDAAGRQRLLHDFRLAFSSRSDTLVQLQQTLDPSLRDVLYEVWRSLSVELGEPKPEVHVLRKRASVFGYNAPQALSSAAQVITELKSEIDTDVTPDLETAQKDKIDENIDSILENAAIVELVEPTVIASDPYPERGNTLYLDNAFEKVLPGSLVIIEKPGEDPTVRIVDSVDTHPRTAYGISGTTTELTLTERWWTPGPEKFDVIRGTSVNVESEELQLAEEPIADDVERTSRMTVKGILNGIEAGRLMILTGERTDIAAGSIVATELIEVVGVEQAIDLTLPGDTINTELSLAEPLKHSYRRESVRIHGNVIAATQGETHNEILGSGNGKLAFQQFDLAGTPLTFVASPTVAGAESTLAVRVNDIVWQPSRGFADRDPTDRIYVLTTDDESRTNITFGNGRYGARLPTGSENVTAVYRVGLGRSGNVAAEQIDQLAAKPLGVKSVVNPIRATGGSDRESSDSARRSAPMAVMALDRLVSVRDYAYFARTFAGIDKASATRLSDGSQELVHITIAGSNDIPIDRDSDLFVNLFAALRQYGDPRRHIRLQVRELALLIIDARVRVQPGYQWESVKRDIRAAALDKFSFDRRELGQDVARSEVVDTIQQVPGVSFVDINILDSVPESINAEELRGLTCRLALNSRVTVSTARTRTSFYRRVNLDCAAADFLAAFAIKAIKDPDDPSKDKSALQILQELNPGDLDEITEDDLKDPVTGTPTKTFQQLIADGKLEREKVEFLTVRATESGIRPAQLAYLTPSVPDTLLLSEIPS